MVAYRSGISGSRELVWIDRKGLRGEPVVPVANFVDPDLSPDGRRVAVSLGDIVGTRSEIWIVDLARSVSTKLTFNQKDSATPVWSPDGKYVYFASAGERFMDIYRKAADGSDDQTLIFKSRRTRLSRMSLPTGNRFSSIPACSRAMPISGSFRWMARPLRFP